MSEWQLKRFWTEVNLQESEQGFGILLDGRPVKTPAKTAMAVPARSLAEAIAEEWRAVDGAIDPLRMPLTRAANAAIDKVAIQFEEVADMLADYGASDLLCYRAEGPKPLQDRQAEGWDPLLDWADKTYGTRLKIGYGLMPMCQDADAVARLRAVVHAKSVFQLTALHDLVGITGSLVLGLAVADQEITPERGYELSRIDEQWQIDQWGPDDEAAELAASKLGQLQQAYVFLSLVS